MNLWQEITRVRNLEAAFEKVHRNGGTAGGDGVTSAQYAKRLKKNINELSRKLATGEHRFGECRQLFLPKTKGGFRRLMIPTLEDRIVHTSMATALTPILETEFETSSFAYRPGRSVKQAIERIMELRDQGYTHVIEADIDEYFDSIRHDLLIKELEMLLANINGGDIFLYYLKEDLDEQAHQLSQRGTGLVQGSPLSPLLANVYLDGLDEKMSARHMRIIRYADDFVILCKSRKTAETVFQDLGSFLTKLGLTLNASKSTITAFERGFKFLGHTFSASSVINNSRNRLIEPLSAPTKTRTYADTVPIDTSSAAAENNEIPGPKSTRYDKGERILYVLEKQRWVTSNEHQLIVLTEDRHEIAGFPLRLIDLMIIGPNVKYDNSVIESCISNDITIHLVDGWGQLKARITPKEDVRARLQFQQAVTINTPETSLHLARMIVDARIRNQRTQLQRLSRNKNVHMVDLALLGLKRTLRKLDQAATINEMRGYEGSAGAQYWPALSQLCKTHSGSFKRTRPAKDPLNAAINYMTALLERDIRRSLVTARLHTGFGFLHTPGEYRDAAVYDLMEPFRAPLTEGLPVYLFNANRLKTEYFSSVDSIQRMNGKARTAVIKGYESAVARRVKIPGKNRKLSWRSMMLYQATSLAKAYRESDPDLFCPYVMEA